MVVPLPISLPPSSEPLILLLKMAKKCLGNNFMSSFMTTAGCVMAFHYTSLLEIQDECPLILCYSKTSGTGKNVTMNTKIFYRLHKTLFVQENLHL